MRERDKKGTKKRERKRRGKDGKKWDREMLAKSSSFYKRSYENDWTGKKSVQYNLQEKITKEPGRRMEEVSWGVRLKFNRSRIVI